MGILGHDDDVTDYSPDGVAARVDAARSALRELDGTSPADDVDRVTIAAMRERLGLHIELHDARLDVGDLNVIASPLQSMRDVFDLMATDTDEDWALIGRRMSKVPDRVAGYAEALRAAVAAGRAPAARQVARGIRAGTARSSSCSWTWWPMRRRETLRCMRNCNNAPRRPPTPTARSPPRCATRSHRTLGTRTRSAATRTGCCRGSSSAPPSTSTRPISGACANWKALSPNRNRLRIGSIPGFRSARRCGGWTTSPATWCTAPTPCRPGCRICPTARWNRLPTRTSTSPQPCARWSVGSRRPRPAASTTPDRQRT